MRPRILTYLGFSTLVTASYTWMRELQKQAATNSDPTFQEIPPDTMHDSSYYNISRTLAEKAFRDMGCDKPIYASVGHSTGYSSMATFNQYGRRAAYVRIPSGVEIEPHYAIMGHEAVHVMHEHSLIKSAARGYTWCFSAVAAFHSVTAAIALKNRMSARLAVTSLFFASTIPITIIGRFCEIDADITSARKLGTAQILIQDLRKKNQEQQARLDQRKKQANWNNPHFYYYIMRRIRLFFDYHPPIESRIAYLQKINESARYKLLESQEFKDISARQNNKI